MYEFITHTWNPISGKCSHDCSYCYMKQEKEQSTIHLKDDELKGSFNPNHFIFVGSGTDVFADDVPSNWIKKVLDYCVNKTCSGLFEDFFSEEGKTRFMLQTKNPKRIMEFIDHPLLDPERNQVVICTTLETNRFYPEIMNNAPSPTDRAEWMANISDKGLPTYVTLEPIMDFDLDEFVELIKKCNPVQVNIGYNTNFRVSLPEPSTDKVVKLIERLIPYTKIHLKENSKDIKAKLDIRKIKLE